MQILQLNYVSNDNRVYCPACWDDLDRDDQDEVMEYSEEPCRECGNAPKYVAHIQELGAQDTYPDEDDA